MSHEEPPEDFECWCCSATGDSCGCSNIACEDSPGAQTCIVCCDCDDDDE